MSLLSYSMPQPPPPHKIKKNQQRQQEKVGSSGRLLITVTVMGSPGPLRFLVKEEDVVATVIQTALRSYAREGRLPVLGSDINDFLFYCANSEYKALSHWETISSQGIRNFVLCKKQAVGDAPESEPPNCVLGQKRSRSWKSWFNRSLQFNSISSH